MTAIISDSSSRAHWRVPVVSPASPGEKTQELANYQPYVDRLGDAACAQGDLVACPETGGYGEFMCPRGDLNPHALYGH